LLRADLKPDNVLVKLVSGGLSGVCISDLGGAKPGNPANRSIDSVDTIRAGLDEGTLAYRSPEVLLGAGDFSYPVDAWSLGCVLGELILGRPVFSAEGAVLVANEIFKIFGRPTDADLVRLPLHRVAGPDLQERPWPPDWLSGQDENLISFLRGLWTLSPGRRLKLCKANLHKYLLPPRLEVVYNQLSGVHGATTVVAAQLEARVRKWLQDEPYCAQAIAELEAPAEQRCKRQCLKLEEKELDKKHEIAGYVTEQPPHCTKMATMDADTLCPAKRVVWFMREFMQVNRAWFEHLTRKIRQGLDTLPDYLLGENGQDFKEDCLGVTGLCYAIIQTMRPGQRLDPKHSDGGASLIHMGLTLRGHRTVHYWFDREETVKSQPQAPGCLYVGNLCTARHQVEHNSQESEPMNIAVMIRSDVFRHNRARALNNKPGPSDVFDIVNAIVAQHLATATLQLPTFEACVQRSMQGS
jgi:hypothetical protein